MIKLLLGLSKAPSPHDAADALAVAICHLHSRTPSIVKAGLKVRPGEPDKARPTRARAVPRTWRQYRPPAHG